jgi:hypothetical protein
MKQRKEIGKGAFGASAVADLPIQCPTNTKLAGVNKRKR